MAAGGQAPAQGAISVSSALQLAKRALEDVSIKITGEVSEVSNKPGYKAVYFTIKDELSSLPCMIWNNKYKACGVELRVGAVVEITGRFSLYAPKGRMNFDATWISLAGEGKLRLQVANLAKQLAAEGLTAPERKRKLPALPQTIGLVTSPRGAAVHDVLRTLRRRFPFAKVLLAGVPVEGADAPIALSAAIECVAGAGAEVVLLVRGGGSFEDLMPFNDEWLARTIAACPVPVVTGIGHEPDTTIADMVSDRRASTPTAAAEVVSEYAMQLVANLNMMGTSLNSSIERALINEKTRLKFIESRPVFEDPQRLFESEAQSVDMFSERLSAALPKYIEQNSHKLEMLESSIKSMLPSTCTSKVQAVRNLQNRMLFVGPVSLRKFSEGLKRGASRLEDLSPLGVIARGYSMAKNEQGKVVSSISQVEAGDSLSVTVSDGVIECKVNDVSEIHMAVLGDEYAVKASGRIKL
jgi:exodeoxyribonuclease VII large subunit